MLTVDDSHPAAEIGRLPLSAHESDWIPVASRLTYCRRAADSLQEPLHTRGRDQGSKRFLRLGQNCCHDPQSGGAFAVHLRRPGSARRLTQTIVSRSSSGTLQGVTVGLLFGDRRPCSINLTLRFAGRASQCSSAGEAEPRLRRAEPGPRRPWPIGHEQLPISGPEFAAGGRDGRGTGRRSPDGPSPGCPWQRLDRRGVSSDSPVQVPSEVLLRSTRRDILIRPNPIPGERAASVARAVSERIFGEGSYVHGRCHAPRRGVGNGI